MGTLSAPPISKLLKKISVTQNRKFFTTMDKSTVSRNHLINGTTATLFATNQWKPSESKTTSSVIDIHNNHTPEVFANKKKDEVDEEWTKSDLLCDATSGILADALGAHTEK